MPLASGFRMWQDESVKLCTRRFFVSKFNDFWYSKVVPVPSYLFLDLSSEQKLNCNREFELSFTAQVGSQTGGIFCVNMDTSWWCHSIGTECYNSMDWSQVHKSFYTTPLAHGQVRDWRVSRNLGTFMTFGALGENWAFKIHLNWSLFVEQQWGDRHLSTGKSTDIDVRDSFHIYNWRHFRRH